jgi:CubicO group peptidase (beta-lactamase class C family)
MEILDDLALIEMYLESEQESQNIPGLSAGIVYDQEILWAKGFGYANLEERIPATIGTLYRIGSVTKIFTAVMLMQLRDKGHLQLDDPVARYLPEFTRLRTDIPITFRHLVSHTSGLPTMPPIEELTAKFEMPDLEDLHQIKYDGSHP